MAKAPKAPSLADQLAAIPTTNHRIWDSLSPEQQGEIDNMLRKWWTLPVYSRPSQRQVAKLVGGYLGHTVNQSTLHAWLHAREPNV